MASYQNITILGNLGRDPVLKYLPSGNPVTNFSVVVSRKYISSSGDKVEDTVWFRVAAWGKSAEACNEYLHKGDKVLVVGRMTAPKVYTDKNGKPACQLDISATSIEFVSTKGASNGSEVADPTGEVPEPDEADVSF